jgi:Ca2+-binding EF-hand superfamily protein
VLTEAEYGRYKADDAVDSREEARFRELDDDRNGYISSEEWEGRQTTFQRLDTNRDGRLTRAELFED